MHENNKKLGTAQFKNVPTRRAEIIIRFDVTEEQASQNYLDAIVGSIKRELKGFEEFAHTSAEVEGKWL